MLIGDVVAFLERVKEDFGNIRLDTVTGFWTRQIPSTGEWIVVGSIGDGKAIGESHMTKERKTVPLKWKDKVVGTCEIAYDDKGYEVIATDITDPKIRELLEGAPPSFSINNTKIVKEETKVPWL